MQSVGYDYEEFPSRTQSPFNNNTNNLNRGAYPGAVLLVSPNSTKATQNNGANIPITANNTGQNNVTLPLTDFLDQQRTMFMDNSKNMPSSMGNFNHPGDHPIIASNLNQSPTVEVSTLPNHSQNNSAGSELLSPTPYYMDVDEKKIKHQYYSPINNHTRLPNNSNPNSHQQDTNISLSFSQDLNNLCSWVTQLSTAQQNILMSTFLPLLNEEVLNASKQKLNNILLTYDNMNIQAQNQNHAQKHFSNDVASHELLSVSSPVMSRGSSPIMRDNTYSLNNIDTLFKNDSTPTSSQGTINYKNNSSMFNQWGNSIPFKNSLLNDFNNEFQRPKSVDPYVLKTMNNNTSNNLLYNKKHNHSNQNSHNVNNSNNNNNNNNNINNVYNGLNPKIMSRNKSYNDYENTNKHNPYNSGSKNSQWNSRSNTDFQSDNHNTSYNSNSNNSNNNYTNNNNGNSANNNNPYGGNNNSSMNPNSLTDPKLLVNIPLWLKSLRLHKYSEALKDIKWTDLIVLNDSELEELGITALGARRKLLKAFVIVIEYKEKGLIPSSAFTDISVAPTPSTIGGNLSV